LSTASNTLTSFPPRELAQPKGQSVVFTFGLWLLLAFAVYVPLQDKIDMRFHQVVHVEFPEGLAFVNLLFMIAILRWIGTRSDAQNSDFRMRLMTVSFAAVVLASTISFFTGQVYTSAAFFLYDLINWKRTASMILVYFFTKKLLSNRKQVVVLLWAMAIVVGFAGFNLLRENFSSGMSASHFKDSLRFGGIFGWGGENDLGAFLSEFVFIPLILLRLEKGLLKKSFLILLIVMAVTGCIFTYSRGAWIALAGGTIIYVWRHSKILLGVVVSLALLVGTTILPTSVIDRWNMTEDTQTGQLESSAQNRVDVWQEGLDVVKSHPIFGVGYDKFASAVAMHIEPHNAYLKIAAEQGVPALLIFLLLLGVVLWNSSGARDPFEKEISVAFSACWVAFVLVNMFGNRYFREGLICYFWMFAGIVVWLRSQRIVRDHEESQADEPKSPQLDSLVARRRNALRAGTILASNR
jgi:putative inorganic carbon (hco3(-)) transporter